MAFTGVRAAESQRRSEYDTVDKGHKHSGQYSCHLILEWNSAELFLYIYQNDLIMNKAYIKGSTRAGCLVCPHSSGKHEYVKRIAYKKEVDFFLNEIQNTSGKTNFSTSELKDFIDAGFWKTRKSGRELNFGQDKFEFGTENHIPIITIYQSTLEWAHWGKTIGDLTKYSEEEYSICYLDKIYHIKIEFTENKQVFRLISCVNTKNDIKFVSLFRSVIIKSMSCVACGVCETECKSHCISSTDKTIEIGENCTHCYQCHNIQDHCIWYSSIRNKLTEGKKMAGLDRYYSFGIREEWMELFFKYRGGEEFWITDGDGQVANKKKDAFLNFLKDADLVKYDKKVSGDKYVKYQASPFAQALFDIQGNTDQIWGGYPIKLSVYPCLSLVCNQFRTKCQL